jgi:hypothetical protein
VGGIPATEAGVFASPVFGIPEHILPGGSYRITLLGQTENAILSQEGTRLDGEPADFPSGNNVEGGNFVFDFVIASRR